MVVSSLVAFGSFTIFSIGSTCWIHQALIFSSLIAIFYVVTVDIGEHG